MNCHLKQTQGGVKQIEDIKYRAILYPYLLLAANGSQICREKQRRVDQCICLNRK